MILLLYTYLMQLNISQLHCLIMAHLCIHLENDHAEHEQELQVEPEPVEDSTNLDQAQGMFRCILPIFPDFGFAK
jgi:hypothetical protein